MKKILLAIDGSETSLRAAEEALKLASAFNSEVVIISVAQRPQTMAHVAFEGITSKELEEAQKNILDQTVSVLVTLLKREAQKFVEAGIKVTTKVIIGRPTERIIVEANEGDYDLLVIGSRGLSAVKRFILGTVSDKVANNVTCPVYIVK